jgi:hypothetical protein
MQLSPMEPTQLLDKFLRGLKLKMRMELELKGPESLAEAIRFADRFVYRYTVPLAPSAPSRSYEYESSGEPMQIDAMRTKTPSNPRTPTLKKLIAEEYKYLRSIGYCFRCRKNGHVSRECPSKALSGSSKTLNHQ